MEDRWKLMNGWYLQFRKSLCNKRSKWLFHLLKVEKLAYDIKRMAAGCDPFPFAPPPCRTSHTSCDSCHLIPKNLCVGFHCLPLPLLRR